MADATMKEVPIHLKPRDGVIVVKVLGADGERETMEVPAFIRDRSNVLGAMYDDLGAEAEGVEVPLEITREHMDTIVGFYQAHHAAFSSETSDEPWDENKARAWDEMATKQLKTKAEKCRFGTLTPANKEQSEFFADVPSPYLNQLNATANKFDMPAFLLAGATMLATRVQGMTQNQVLEHFGLPPQTEEQNAKDREAVIARHPWLVGRKKEPKIVPAPMEEDAAAAAAPE